MERDRKEIMSHTKNIKGIFVQVLDVSIVESNKQISSHSEKIYIVHMGTSHFKTNLVKARAQKLLWF